MSGRERRDEAHTRRQRPVMGGGADAAGAVRGTEMGPGSGPGGQHYEDKEGGLRKSRPVTKSG